MEEEKKMKVWNKEAKEEIMMRRSKKRRREGRMEGEKGDGTKEEREVKEVKRKWEEGKGGWWRKKIIGRERTWRKNSKEMKMRRRGEMKERKRECGNWNKKKKKENNRK